MEDRTKTCYFLGKIATILVMRYWHPSKQKDNWIQYNYKAQWIWNFRSKWKIISRIQDNIKFSSGAKYCLFNWFDKMHNFGTLSWPFIRSNILKGKNILPTSLLFELKLTFVLNFYEIKVRMCTNGSKIIHDQDYTVSYTSIVDIDSFRWTTAIVASDEMIVVFIDASNCISNKRHMNPK